MDGEVGVRELVLDGLEVGRHRPGVMLLLGRRGEGGGGIGVTEGGAQLDHLLLEQKLLVLDGQDALLQAVVDVFNVGLLALEPLHLLPLTFARGLGGGSVAEDALDAALFLFIIRLGSFPIRSS